jgi:hypothetical protein
MQCSAALRWRCSHRLFPGLRGRVAQPQVFLAWRPRFDRNPEPIIVIIAKADIAFNAIGRPPVSRLSWRSMECRKAKAWGRPMVPPKLMFTFEHFVPRCVALRNRRGLSARRGN